MRKLIKVQFKIKYFENIKDNIDIKLMYIVLTSIDQSYYLNVVFKTELTDLILVIFNFQINIIYYLTDQHLLILFFIYIV
jgi:hypothetical protein